MHKKEEHIDYELIARYLSGELVDRELEEMDQWAGSSNENKLIIEECKKVFSTSFKEDVPERSKSVPSFNSKTAWENIAGRIGSTETPDIPVIQLEESRSAPLSRAFWIRIAAVMVLGLGAVFYFVQRPSGTTTVTSNEFIREILLPDSSEVILNVKSSISFKKGFSIDHRDLILKGTAYFDVNRDESLTFSINAGRGIIEVLGTAFMIKETTDTLTVTVERGHVRLTSLADEQGEVELARNERAILTTSGSIEKTVVESLNNLFWANKKLIYKQESLKTVFAEMSQIFNKNIKYDGVAISNCRISAVFNDESFESMMDHMALALDFEYTTSGNVVIVTSNGCTEN